MVKGLIADIGGTNARFTLVAEDGAIGAPRIYACADFPDPGAAARRFLDEVAPDRKPRQGAFCFACPITGDRISVTNHPWVFSIDETRRALDLDSLKVINDFTAVALSVPRLTVADRRQVGGGTPVAREPMAVIGPGTGLGVSGLVPSEDGTDWSPLAGEGGHVGLAPANAREDAVVAALRDRFGHVSAERAVSGQGLVNLYKALCRIDGLDAEPFSPADVTRRGAKNIDPACAEAVDMFCSVLGATAGNLVLTLGARGGVYIAGGIVPRLGPAFDASPFRTAFEAKGRMSNFVAGVPTYVVTHPYPAFLGLTGLLDG